MTLRRRFFPAQGAQATPAQSVELEVQLRPDAPALAGGCTCNVWGAALYPEMAIAGEQDPQNPRYVSPSVFDFYKPRLAGGRLTGGYMKIPSQWEGSCFVRAVLLGATLCDVAWQWSLDAPPLESPNGYAYDAHWGGVQVTPEGGTLLIEILPGQFFDYTPWWAALELTVTCAGEPAGSLSLRPGNQIWQPEILPPWG